MLVISLPACTKLVSWTCLACVHSMCGEKKVGNNNVSICCLIHVLRKHSVALQSKYLTRRTKYNTKGRWWLTEVGTWGLKALWHLLPWVMSDEQKSFSLSLFFLPYFLPFPVLWGEPLVNKAPLGQDVKPFNLAGFIDGPTIIIHPLRDHT